MRIEQVDFHYLAMPVIKNIGDGSQDALLVRVVMDDGTVGFGECEAAPLVSIAAWCCPMSHLACKPLKDTVVGYEINTPDDIAALTADVRCNSFDLLQADHTLSGIDMALWDAISRKAQVPVWAMLGYKKAYAKTAYASQLFGDTPEETRKKGEQTRAHGYKAAKFGWGPFGHGTVEQDIAHIEAARAGLGNDIALLVDAGTVWGENVERAAKVLPALNDCKTVWLEEPFHAQAFHAYAKLADMAGNVRLAGGEGSHLPAMAKNLMDFGKVGFIQIDAGRIGGISSSFEVAKYAQQTGIQYVNHTFTTSLALSASLQPFAGMESSTLCEFPVESTELAQVLTTKRLLPNANGQLDISDKPGLGLDIDWTQVERFALPVEISVSGKTIWSMK